MSPAWSEVIYYLYYCMLITAGIAFGILALRTKSLLRKILCFISSIVFFLLFGRQRYNDESGHRKWELENVGTYYLTDYPGCDSCRAMLNEDNSYRVIKKDGSLLEKGDWHFESGGDYLIVYMNSKRDELGNGRFQYSFFVDRQNKRYESPKVGP